MEPVGLVLATIPLIVTTLDKHVETLDAIRLFRTEKYRRLIERYSNILEAQQTSLINAIEIILGVEISNEAIKSFWAQPNSTNLVWKDRALQEKLQKNLGRDYEVFVKVIAEAKTALEELNQRLEDEVSIPSNGTQPRVMTEIRKAKIILSKRRYNALFDGLDTSIGLLQRIVDQSLQRQERTKIDRSSRCAIVRSPAASVHKALLREDFWACPCRDKHSVLLTVSLDLEATKTSEVLFRIALATANDANQSLYCWQEIEVEPSQKQTPVVQISQLCSITTMSVMSGERKVIGSLWEGNYRHILSITRSNTGVLEPQNLEELLMSSTLAVWIPGFYFPKRDRLYLATRLAWSVLQFHGNWLREHWRTRDIIFPKEPGGTNSQTQSLRHPYLLWNVSQGGVTSPNLSSAVMSQVLFPLALALIELSLCRPISVLKKPEDENPEEAVTLLKTANRCIASVSIESGERYGTVVQRCLHWSETRETDPNDEVFRASFYGLIVTPLMDIQKAFDGTSTASVR